MTLDEFRREMEAYRQDVVRQAIKLRDGHHAIDRMRALYRQFDAAERLMADQVLAEWSLSDDENMRSYGEALIDDFRIVTARKALESLAERLASSGDVGAPYEIEKVNRIIENLRGKNKPV